MTSHAPAQNVDHWCVFLCEFESLSYLAGVPAIQNFIIIVWLFLVMRLTTLITIYPLRLTAKSMLSCYCQTWNRYCWLAARWDTFLWWPTITYIFCKAFYFASIACVILIVADALLADALFPNRPQAISSHHANSVMLGSTNEIRRYIVTSSLIGCAYSHNGFFFLPFFVHRSDIQFLDGQW